MAILEEGEAAVEDKGMEMLVGEVREEREGEEEGREGNSELSRRRKIGVGKGLEVVEEMW